RVSVEEARCRSTSSSPSARPLDGTWSSDSLQREYAGSGEDSQDERHAYFDPDEQLQDRQVRGTDRPWEMVVP
ncbi:hypothetical protein PENTCL1PPCAC_25959, partial [Pristionchus entomophagus]